MSFGWHARSLFFGTGVPEAVHLSLSNMTSEWVEINAVPLEDFFIKPAYRPVDEYVSAPDSPELGFEIDWEVVNQYIAEEKSIESLYY